VGDGRVRHVESVQEVARPSVEHGGVGLGWVLGCGVAPVTCVTLRSTGRHHEDRADRWLWGLRPNLGVWTIRMGLGESCKKRGATETAR
jgi:hypothetical protein